MEPAIIQCPEQSLHFQLLQCAGTSIWPWSQTMLPSKTDIYRGDRLSFFWGISGTVTY